MYVAMPLYPNNMSQPAFPRVARQHHQMHQQGPRPMDHQMHKQGPRPMDHQMLQQVYMDHQRFMLTTPRVDISTKYGYVRHSGEDRRVSGEVMGGN